MWRTSPGAQTERRGGAGPVGGLLGGKAPPAAFFQRSGQAVPGRCLYKRIRRRNHARILNPTPSSRTDHKSVLRITDSSCPTVPPPRGEAVAASVAGSRCSQQPPGLLWAAAAPCLSPPSGATLSL